LCFTCCRLIHPDRHGGSELDERSILIASFGFGVALQAMLLIRGNWNWWKIAGCVGFAMIAMFPGKHERDYETLFHVLMVFSFFSVIFAFTFRESILPLISESVLLSYTLVFWFAFFTYFYDSTPLCILLLVLLSIPTAATVFVALRKTRLGFVLKLVLYTWFLIIIVGLGAFQFPFSQLKLFFEDQQVPWVTPVESATAGMAFLFLLANGWYLYDLIPIPGRGQSWANRMKEWHEFTDLLTQRFTDAQIALVQAVIVICVEGAALLLNAIYRWLPPGLVINLAIVIPAIVLHPRLLPMPTGPAQPSGAEIAPRIPHSRHLLKGKYRRPP
jgi:hypothetical protein